MIEAVGRIPAPRRAGNHKAQSAAPISFAGEWAEATPAFNATPDTLQYEITPGTGTGEHAAFGRSTIATGAKPWSQEQDNHKLFTDDAPD